MYRAKRRKVIEEGFAECGSSEYAPWEGHWAVGEIRKVVETMRVFSNQHLQGCYPALSHVVYGVYQCMFEMHTLWSQSCTHTSHLLQPLFMSDDFSLKCTKALVRVVSFHIVALFTSSYQS